MTMTYRQRERATMIATIGIITAVAFVIMLVVVTVWPQTYTKVEGKCVVQVENVWHEREVARVCQP